MLLDGIRHLAFASIYVLLLAQVVPACCPIIVIFDIALCTISVHFLAVVWITLADFDRFPFFIAAIDSLRD
jgi:hypothetical protein